MPVTNRNTETQLPIIRKYVAANLIIHTDKWCAYDDMFNENYTHRTVNHSAYFIDPATDVHAQNIEKIVEGYEMKYSSL